jgi:acyl-CoA thioester hydrolase
MLSRAVPGEKRINMALVRLEIDFLHEIQYPATLKIGIRLLKLGRSSLTKACALFNGDVCCSTAIAILVCFDPVARASKPFSDAQRKLLEADL